ncbi:MAG TPA: putative sulfate exporter family transporter [Bacteroidales bacterium]|nr:putative sulfate exporter family transporter [Bacteroidales bacterium]
MRKLLKNEDWLAFFSGIIVVLAAWAGFYFPSVKFGWSDAGSLKDLFTSTGNLNGIGGMLLLLICAGLATFFLGKKNITQLVVTILIVFTMSLISQGLAGYKPVKYYGFEYVIFALIAGIIVRNVFGLPKWLAENLHSEFFIKTGLVILGSGIIFGDIIKAGALGLVQAIVVVLAVWFFAYWIAKKLKVDDEMALMLSSAVSICGVSAAIATAGAIKGDGKKLSYVVSLVLIVALPMLILLPIAARYMGLNPAQAGAWFGGTIDTSGAVVASGTIFGEEALKFSTIVKFSQNVLIGFAAVAISVFWVLKGRKDDISGKDQKVDFRIIWQRFPKFVLGFIAASLIYSFLVDPVSIAATKDYLKGIQTAFFAVAFVGIGLETDFSLLIKTGSGRPAWAFLIAQCFNILFTLLLAYYLFMKV